MAAPQEDPAPRRGPAYPSLPGLWIGTVLAFASFTPSLLPRPVVYQGLVAGVVCAIGYGLGVAVTAVVRELRDRPAGRWGPRAWRVWRVWVLVGSVVSLVAGHLWHRQSSALVGLEPTSPFLVPLTPVVAVLVFVLLLAVGRGLRAVTRRTARWLERRTSPRAARVIGTGSVVVVTALLFSGVLLDGIVTTIDRSAAVGDLITPDDVEVPTSPLRSGSPDSLIEWDGLGREGRTFVGRGPSADDITALTGEPAEEPVRIFARLASAEDERERARLAAADLERAGGFDRARLLVVTTTGTGWVEPSAATSFEFLSGGDSAIVSMQYSHLPSPISYWVDEERARAAGRALFDAVYGRLAAMPAEDRPELYVFGESLGSFGGEAAFSGDEDLSTRVDGALFVGPPSFNPLYREIVDSRDAGSPEIEAEFRDGEAVRFTLDARRPTRPDGSPWPGSRVLYFQHASDPGHLVEPGPDPAAPRLARGGARPGRLGVDDVDPAGHLRAGLGRPRPGVRHATRHGPHLLRPARLRLGPGPRHRLAPRTARRALAAHDPPAVTTYSSPGTNRQSSPSRTSAPSICCESSPIPTTRNRRPGRSTRPFCSSSEDAP